MVSGTLLAQPFNSLYRNKTTWHLEHDNSSKIGKLIYVYSLIITNRTKNLHSLALKYSLIYITHLYRILNRLCCDILFHKICVFWNGGVPFLFCFIEIVFSEIFGLQDLLRAQLSEILLYFHTNFFLAYCEKTHYCVTIVNS